MSVAINLRSLYRHVADERPRTVGEQQKAGSTLLREPSKPTARTASMHISMDAMVHDPTYPNLCEFARWVVGPEEWSKNSNFWRRLAYNHPNRLHEELLEVRRLKLEGRSPDNPAAYILSFLKDIFPTGDHKTPGPA